MCSVFDFFLPFYLAENLKHYLDWHSHQFQWHVGKVSDGFWKQLIMDSLKTNQQIKINTAEAEKFCFKVVFPHAVFPF